MREHIEGEHVVCFCSPERLDKVGFAFRQRNVEVRDSVYISTSDHTYIALLGHRESDRTVLETVVRYGTGVLNIDRGHISHNEPADYTSRTSDKSGWMYRDGRSRNKGGLRSPNPSGRFPTNVLFVHDTECECVGTKKVKTGTAHRDGAEIANQIYQGEWSQEGISGKHGYGGEDGLEEVLDWDCHSSCPVRLLDEQSFEMGIHGAGHARNHVHDDTYDANTYDLGGRRQMDRYGDEGGASRFFYQGRSTQEVVAYLEDLTGQQVEVKDE